MTTWGTWGARVILALAVVCSAACGPAFAQPAAALKSSKIEIAYLPPKTAKYNAILERMKRHHVLELLSEFVSPLRLPHEFTLLTKECGETNAFYSPRDWSLTLCYELIEYIDGIAPAQGTTKDGFTSDEVETGEIIFTLLHELGHAAFDMFYVPVFGREEDAADQMAVFIALQFNQKVARTIARGDYYFFKNQGEDRKQWSYFADEHGTSEQRL